ncbi:MAG: MarP family serine protease [Actinomycetota bacterium]|nr:MarP family serine protease [Actinomycetota bacterium]
MGTKLADDVRTPRHWGKTWHLNVFDFLVLAALASAAIGGYRMGFLARVLSWVGLAAGIYAAARLAPVVLDQVQGGQPETRLLLTLGVMLVASTAGASLGAVAGQSVRQLIPPGTGLRTADRTAGAAVGGLGALLLVWLLLPILAEMPGVVSEVARNSSIARSIDRYGPGTPQALQDLRRQVSDFNFPQVFSRLGPSPSTGPPPEDIALPAAVRDRVAVSTVKVTGTACGRLLSGSGFTSGPETIVTNAHVVAGVDRPSVLRTDGRRLAGTVVAFDPDRDLAVLRVPGLGREALPVGEADVGDEGAVFGHPRGQDALAISPARVETKVNARGLDLYGESTISREVLVLASALEPGDSGGALVNVAGRVIGVAFAVAPDRPATAYALSSGELNEVLAQARTGQVDTGPCIRG